MTTRLSKINDLKIISVLQSINITVYFALSLSFPWGGPVIWFFGGIFMLLVQFPGFLILLVMQGVELFMAWKKKSPTRAALHLVPWGILAICLLISSLMSSFHLNDPFYHDAYKIKVEFNPDGSCLIMFDGKQRGKKTTYEYDRSDGIAAYCRDEVEHISGHVSFTRSPGRYPIHDSQGDISKNGGAYFDEQLGSELSPSFLGTVYWDFVDGEIEVKSVRNFAEKNTSGEWEKKESISVVVDAIGKRRFRGF